MGKLENTPNVNSLDAYSKDQWVDFLKQGAYRGLKINKVARRLGKSKACVYDKATHKLELINEKGKTITLDMSKLLKKNERWTLSRFMHNIKMCFTGSKYAFNFDHRIYKLAELISKNDLSTELDSFVIADHGLSEIKTTFYRNLREINQSTGDKEIQDNLLKLSAKAFEQANDAKSRSLAFQIQCTAQAMVPDPNLVWEVLPQDIHNLLFSQVCKNEGVVNHPLSLVSKQLHNTLNVSDNLVDEDDICLRANGCRTAKEAVAYIIENKLTSADLSSFRVTETDLDELSKNYPQLKKLSLPEMNFDKTMLLEAMQKFTNIKNLDLSMYSCYDPDDFLIEVAKLHPSLQHLGVRNINNNKLVEAIKELDNLKSLKCGCEFDKYQISGIAKTHPNLTNLEFDGVNISGDKMLEIAKCLPNLQHLRLNVNWIARTHIFELASLPNLQSLDVSELTFDQCLEIAQAFPHLKKLDFRIWLILGSQVIEIVKLLPNLRDLKIRSIEEFSDAQLVKMAKLLPNLLYLEIYRCTQIDKIRLEEAFKHHPKLKIRIVNLIG